MSSDYKKDCEKMKQEMQENCEKMKQEMQETKERMAKSSALTELTHENYLKLYQAFEKKTDIAWIATAMVNIAKATAMLRVEQEKYRFLKEDQTGEDAKKQIATYGFFEEVIKALGANGLILEGKK